jgi:hypothetical protein
MGSKFALIVEASSCISAMKMFRPLRSGRSNTKISGREPYEQTGSVRLSIE